MDDKKKTVDLDGLLAVFLDADRSPPSMPIKVVAGTMASILIYTHAHAHSDRPSPPYSPDEHIQEATSTSSLSPVYDVQTIRFDLAALKKLKL